MAERSISLVSKGVLATDGAGVKLTRIIGSPELDSLDPFLLLDAFESDNPEDYIGGFPEHPHRGFETVTYLLEGQMRHKDSAGNEGVIGPGGVQWMTAGKGILHSEMPEQLDGWLMGFQLWVNLPAAAKMSEPRYQEFSASEIAIEEWNSGSRIAVISGRTDRGTEGPVKNSFVNPTYLDVSLKSGDGFQQSLPDDDSAFIYLISGGIRVGSQGQVVEERSLAVLSEGDCVSVIADGDSRFLLVAGQPLRESVARGGPFVMNTRAEVLEAFDDFRNGKIG